MLEFSIATHRSANNFALSAVSPAARPSRRGRATMRAYEAQGPTTEWRRQSSLLAAHLDDMEKRCEEMPRNLYESA